MTILSYDTWRVSGTGGRTLINHPRVGQLGQRTSSGLPEPWATVFFESESLVYISFHLRINRLKTFEEASYPSPPPGRGDLVKQDVNKNATMRLRCQIKRGICRNLVG